MEGYLKKKLNPVLDNLNNKTYMAANSFYVVTAGLVLGFALWRIGGMVMIQKAAEWNKNWAAVRCKPHVIPFAGNVRRVPGKSGLQVTAENFIHCVSGVMGASINSYVRPFYNVQGLFAGVLKGLVETTQAVRERILSALTSIFSIFSNVFGSIRASMLPVQMVLIRTHDMLKKASGALKAVVGVVVGSYYSAMNALRTYLHSMRSMMLAMVALIAVLIGFIFTAPAAVPVMAMLAVMSGLMVTATAYMSDILGESVAGFPIGRGACFGANTEMRMEDGTTKTIDMIVPGDVLHKDGRVNTVVQVSARTQEVFYIPSAGTYVSGTHMIVYHKRWYSVRDLYNHLRRRGAGAGPDESVVGGGTAGAGGGRRDGRGRLVILRCDGEEHARYTAEYLYCLNTESGYMRVGGLLFSDWNDIDHHEYDEMSELSLFNVERPSDIHAYFEGGFAPYTQIAMANGTMRPINRIKIGDVLACGSIVTGTVESFCNDVDLYRCNVYGSIITGAANNIAVINSATDPVSGDERNRVVSPQTRRRHSSVTASTAARTASSGSVDVPVLAASPDYVLPTLPEQIRSHISLHGFRKTALSAHERPAFINHLITSTGTFHVNGVQFCDYYACTENYLK
jgi:hypothetical protein